MLQDAFIWLGETGAGQFLADSTTAFAVTQSLHILSFGLLGGTFLALDLAAIGVVFRRLDIVELGQALFPVLLIAVAGAAASGVLLVAAGPMKYFTNPLFPLKLATLGAALAVQLAIYPGLTLAGPGATRRRLAAGLGVLSLLLWMGGAILGRWLGLI